MSQPAKAQEPSMEEILASIRRIIADDDASKPRKPAEPPPPRRRRRRRSRAGAAAAAPPRAAAEQDQATSTPCWPNSTRRPSRRRGADVLDLTEAMAAPPAEAGAELPHHRRPGRRGVHRPAARAAGAAARARPRRRAHGEPRRRVSRGMPDRALVSRATAAAVDSAFNSLAQTVLVKTRARSKTW